MPGPQKEVNDIISDVIAREGGFVNDSSDFGKRTNFGISERSNPQAWADGKVTEEEARAIYEQKYIKWPGFDKIADPSLQAQLIDFGVNSGPAIAIQKLQGILNVDADGVIGPQTLAALATMDARFVNNLLVAARIKMICKIVQKNPSQLKWLSGWCNRSLEFLK